MRKIRSSDSRHSMIGTRWMWGKSKLQSSGIDYFADDRGGIFNPPPAATTASLTSSGMICSKVYMYLIDNARDALRWEKYDINYHNWINVKKKKRNGTTLRILLFSYYKGFENTRLLGLNLTEPTRSWRWFLVKLYRFSYKMCIGKTKKNILLPIFYLQRKDNNDWSVLPPSSARYFSSAFRKERISRQSIAISTSTIDNFSRTHERRFRLIELNRRQEWNERRGNILWMKNHDPRIIRDLYTC